MFECFNNVEEKCIACSVKHIYNVTKWSGYFCFQIGCKHSRTNKAVSLSKKSISITVFLCIFMLCSIGESIISIVNTQYGSTGEFFRFLFIIVGGIAILICTNIFLLQIQIAKDALTNLFDIINETFFCIGIYWRKRQLKIYECKSLFLCLLVILSIIVAVIFYRLYGNGPHISYVQEISIYIISYHYLSYTIATYMLMEMYSLLIEAFEKYVKILLSNITGNKNKVIVMYNIAKLRNVIKLYLKIYFSFQRFVYYYSPNIVIFMVGLGFCFLLLNLSVSFYALEGQIDYFSIVLLLISITYSVTVFLNTDILMRQVSILNINFCYKNCYKKYNT